MKMLHGKIVIAVGHAQKYEDNGSFIRRTNHNLDASKRFIYTKEDLIVGDQI